jgi:carboxypeptidase A1
MSRFLEKSANASIPTRVYIDAHAFSQLWMFPFGWTCDTVKGLDKVEEAAKRGAAALKAVHGKSFAVGGICK